MESNFSFCKWTHRRQTDRHIEKYGKVNAYIFTTLLWKGSKCSATCRIKKVTYSIHCVHRMSQMVAVTNKRTKNTK